MTGPWSGAERLCVIAAGLWLIACSDTHSSPRPQLAAAGGDSDFEITLETTECYGTCPAYDLTIRSTGDVRFTGKGFVWKPGTYEKQVTAEKVARLYRKIVRSGFLDFRSSYATSEDGCDVATDSPTSIFGLRTDQDWKTVEYYYGCSGDFPELAILRDLQKQIVATAEVGEWVKADRTRCQFREPYFAFFLPSYLLRDSSDLPVGLLRVEGGASKPQSSWSVVTCDGEELARGDSMERWDCGMTLLPENETTMSWPGTDTPQAAVLLTVPMDAPSGGPALKLDAILFTQTGEQQQHAARGDSCD
jgi:hypothetical protein